MSLAPSSKNDVPLIRCQYYGGHFIVVSRLEDVAKFEEYLGCNLGVVVQNAQRKDPDRRGPTDKRVLALSETLGINNRDSSIFLTLYEGFYLLQSLKIQIEDQRLDSHNQLDIYKAWEVFREVYKDSIIPLDFAAEYGAYLYFCSKGWVTKSGENYGANFLLYRKGPSLDHAQYAVIVLTNERTVSWKTLLAYYRVIQSVSKELLIAYLELPLDLTGPDSIEKINITTSVFSRHSTSLDMS